MKKVIFILLSSTLMFGCASNDTSSNDSAKAEEKKNCSYIKITGQKRPKRVCES